MPPAASVIGKHHPFHTCIRFDAHRGDRIILISPCTQTNIGGKFLCPFVDGIGKEPVTGGNDPLFLFFFRILCKAVFALTPGGGIIVSEIIDEAVRGCGLGKIGNILCKNFNDRRIGSTGLGDGSAVETSDTLSFIKGEIIRVFSKKFFRKCLLFFGTSYFTTFGIRYAIGSYKRPESVTAGRHFKIHFSKSFFEFLFEKNRTGNGKTHIVSYAPCPGIKVFGIPALADCSPFTVEEVRIVFIFAFGNGDGGFYFIVFPFIPGIEPANTAITFQDFISSIKDTPFIESGNGESISFCSKAESVFFQEFIFFQDLKGDNGLSFNCLIGDDRLFPFGDFP